MLKFFLLDKRHVIGKDRLNIFKDTELITVPTDFANYKSAKHGLPKRCENYWLSVADSSVFASTIDCYGRNFFRVNPKMEGFGLRPAINYEDIKPFSEEFYQDADSIMVKFGTYPQDFVDSRTQVVLDNLYSAGKLEKTKNPGVFKYHGFYLVRDDINNKWISQSPIVWVVDKKSGIAVSDRIIDASKKNYNEVVNFLENDFGKIIFSEDKVKEYNALKTYNILQKRKKETESKLESINSMISHLDEEIAILKRKKN